MRRAELTPLQQDILDIVQNHGPVTTFDVLYHWPVSESSARSALRRLENLGLVGRDYTSRDYAPARFGYVAERTGQ